MSHTNGGSDDEGFVLRIRGLPWSATKEEIVNFFKNKDPVVNIKDDVNGVHMTLSREGRPSGEAYVELETEEDLTNGLARNNDHMGNRYIEVFRSKHSEMDWVVKRSGAHQQDALNDGCVRLRGLPFGCSKEEIAQFFSGLEIVPNGISLPTDYQGRSTGEAFVQFASRDIAEKSLAKHKDKIGHRYIEIFKSSLQEVRVALGMGMPKMRGPPMGSSRPSPYDRNDRFGGPSRYGQMGRGGGGGRSFRGFMNDDYSDYGNNFGNSYGGYGMRPDMGSRGGMGRGNFMGGGGSSSGGGGGGFGGRRDDYGSGGTIGHYIHMRGLPFRAIDTDIYDFFRPLNPVNVHVLSDDMGRPSGEADVEFATHEEAVKAMSKDKANMQHRYIELFLNSTPNPMGGGGSMGGCMGSTGNMGGGMGGQQMGSSGGGGFGQMGGSTGMGSMGGTTGMGSMGGSGGMGYGMGSGQGTGQMGGGFSSSSLSGGSSMGGMSGGSFYGGGGGGYNNQAMGGGMLGGTNYTAF